MRRLLIGLAALAMLGAGAVYLASAPRQLSAAEIDALPEGDAMRGEQWFWAGGCAACHAAAKAEGDALRLLAGGQVLETPFGDFVAPNISPDPEHGIGGWNAADFANAMLRGVGPDGQPYYPAFPYASYARMRPGDVADLWAFLKTLPQSDYSPPGHTLDFPFNIRRGLGLWQRLYLTEAPVVTIDDDDPLLDRGRYLVEGPGHCGECHTPRNPIGATKFDRWLAGAPSPEGPGRIPNITSGEGGIGGWSAADIAYYLETGFTPEFDTAGGAMVAVQRNLAMLDPTDRDAIAAYLKAVPPQSE